MTREATPNTQRQMPQDYWWNEDYLELLAKRLNLASCETMVEVGCGPGYLGFQLAEYLKPGASVFGLDREKKWVDLAAQRAKEVPNPNQVTFQFITGDPKNLHLPDNFADITLGRTLLFQAQDPAAVIRQMQRVTKPGGWIVAVEPNNIINSLLLENLPGDPLEEVQENVEFTWRLERGRNLLREGYNAVGSLLPRIMAATGLEEIHFWVADKALAIIPPYKSPEMKARVEELLGWIESNQGALDRGDSLRYFLAGGGTVKDFEEHWRKLADRKARLRTALEKEEYTSAVGGVLYIAAARK